MLPFMALQAGGAALSGIGGALGDKAKSKAAKQRLKQMQRALQMYQIGSTDAFGNTLSANKNGRWGYNLSRSSRAARDAANYSMNAMNNYRDRSARDIYSQDLSSLINANNSTAQSNQAAAMKNALRQGSNVGYISNAYNQVNSKNIANALLSARKAASNSLGYNTNMRNNLATTAYNAMQPINNIQTNLKDMVNTLNKTQMEQQNAIANAAYDKTLASRMQTANMFTGAGGALSGIGQNMQQQNNFGNLINAIKNNPQMLKFLGY